MVDERTHGLALYVSPGCFYCARVTRALGDLGVSLELRDTWANPEFSRDLYGALGRGTVPVLRIEAADGTVTWLPESLDIVAWLKARFGGRS